jgi:hypothetical protein
MRTNLATFKPWQVFLNYPFDKEFTGLANAMSFAVVASGLIPVCAYDFFSQKSRLEKLVEAILNCRFSAHDLSRSHGEGPQNFVRMNMPLEMGMALFHALHAQKDEHLCIFFVNDRNYHIYASDLSGIEPIIHEGKEERLLCDMVDWLRGASASSLLSPPKATIKVADKYKEFKKRIADVRGSSEGGLPSHDESRELMYQICAEAGWWKWRENILAVSEFPIVPIASKQEGV